MDKLEIGKKGEDFAAGYFLKRGYEILERNYHSRYGEVDIIAKSGKALVFVEVKTRKESSLVSPAQSVTPQKQRKLMLTAVNYLQKSNEEFEPRFDVFEVWQNDGRIFKFNHIENAFEFSDFSGRYDIF